MQYCTAPDALFKYGYEENIKTCWGFCFGMVSAWSLFWYCWPSIEEYKNWSTSCSDWQFLFFILMMMSGARTQKNCRWHPSRRLLSTIFAGGVSMIGLKGKRVGNSTQSIRISKNHRQDVERVAESKIFPNWHVFISIFVQKTEEKVENTVPWWVSCKKYMCSS